MVGVNSVLQTTDVRATRRELDERSPDTFDSVWGLPHSYSLSLEGMGCVLPSSGCLMCVQRVCVDFCVKCRVEGYCRCVEVCASHILIKNERDDL